MMHILIFILASIVIYMTKFGKKSNIEGANIEGANIEGANIEGANIEGANIEGANIEGANIEGYVNISPHLYSQSVTYAPATNIGINNKVGSSVGNKNKNKNFGNFGIFGGHPPYVQCPSCKLDYNCTSFDYDIYSDEKQMNVCTKCDGLRRRNYHDLRMKMHTKGKMAGRTQIGQRLNTVAKPTPKRTFNPFLLI